MQTEEPKKRRLWIPALIIGVVLSGIIIAQFGDPGKEDLIIRNDTDYMQILQNTEKSYKDVLEKLTREEELTQSDKERLVECEAQFHAIMQYEPKNFAPYLVLGMIYHSLDNPKAAEQHLRRCIQFAPPFTNNSDVMETSAEAHYQLSRVLTDKGEYELAVGEASSAISQIPNNALYYIGRSVAYSQLGQKAEAKKDLEQALKIDPTNSRALGMLKLMNRSASKTP